MVVIHYLLRRAARHWQLFLTLSLGVILATALLASGPLLVDTVVEFGLRRKMVAGDVLDRNLRLQTYVPTEEQAVAELDVAVRALLQEWLGDYRSQTVLAVNSYWMIPWVKGEPLLSHQVSLCFYEDIADHAEFAAGAWPAGTGALSDTVPVVVGEAMAQDYGLNVGDRLPLSYKKDDVQPTRWLQVSGIIRPRDPGEAYWFEEFSPLRAQSDELRSAQYCAILPAETFYRGVAAFLPGTKSRVNWNVLLSPGRITVAGIADLRGRIAGLKNDLTHEKEVVPLTTGMDELLTRFSSEAEAVRVPLYILTAEIVLLVLYYAVMVAALSVQQAEREFAILHSRGASGWQVLGIQAAEAGLIGVIALLSGPLLAAALLRGVATWGPLNDVRPADWTLHLTGGAWLAAGVGALAGIVGLLLPVGPMLRRSVVTLQQALVRPTRAPWWQRMYLDVILLLVGFVLLWRLHFYGGGVAGGAVQPRVDWLLLLSPVALLLGSATILLRVFPLILRLFAATTARGRGLPAALAMWQVSRNPARVVLLVLLLTLATALGLLSTGLNATLDASEAERAQYAVGSTMRFTSSYALGSSVLAGEEGVRVVTSVARESGTVDSEAVLRYPEFELLGVDPRLLSQVGTFRDDFADRPVGELLGRIVLDENRSADVLSLPDRPAALGIWLWSLKDADKPVVGYRPRLFGESNLDRVVPTAKLRTADGTYLAVRLEPPSPEVCPYACCADCCPSGSSGEPGGADVCMWRYFSAQLPQLPPASYPLELHSIWFQPDLRTAGFLGFEYDTEIALDDVTVIAAETSQPLVVADFESPTRTWSIDPPESRVQHSTTPLAHAGQGREDLVIAFGYARKAIALRMLRTSGEGELPALASPAFLAATALQVGDSASVWIASLSPLTVRIVGQVSYFPTLYENQPSGSSAPQAGFLVVPRDPLLARLNDRSTAAINTGEVWLSTTGEFSVDRLMRVFPTVDRTWDVRAVRAAVKADPMALGLRSVTLFGTLSTGLLSVVGFATHFYMVARRREVVYAILRAMGLSPRQLYASLVLEQVILILAGLALGTLLGVLLNTLVLPGLPITLSELPPIPPFRAYQDWAAVGRICLVLGGAFLVSIGLATALLWRAQIHRVLRIGEE